MTKCKSIIAALALMVMASAAHANECDGYRDDNSAHSNCITIQLGTILGSEAACGLKYDEDAIKAFIVDQIHDDVSFMSGLKNFIDFAKTEAKERSKSFLAAHCIIVRHAAENEGFLPTAK